MHWPENAGFRSPIDPEKFRAQHDALIDIYRSHGVRVHYIDKQREDRPNAVFCRDLLLMTPEGAIEPGTVVMPAGNPRSQELLEKNGIKVIPVEFDEILKGFGAIHCCTAFLKRG